MANTTKLISLVLRGFEFLWSLLTLALVANMIDEAVAGNAPIVEYAMFVPAFAMFTLLYLIPATITESRLSHPIITLTIDLLNTVVFLVGAMMLAVYLDVHDCGNYAYAAWNLVTGGSLNNEKRCREAQATCAFLWFGFAAFAGSTVLSGLQVTGRANVQGGYIRINGPDMLNAYVEDGYPIDVKS